MKRLVGIFTCALMLGVAASASAGPIEGTFRFSGSVIVSTTDIDWYFVSSEIQPGEDFGSFVINNSTGYFNPLDPPSLSTNFTGEILDLNAVAHPVDTVLNLADFLTVNPLATDSATPNPLPGLTFTLVRINSCVPGACFFPGTPFNFFTDKDGNTTITLSMEGFVTHGVNGPTDWKGTWSADFPDQSIDELRAALLPGGPGFIDTVYSSAVISVPEPATLALLGAGLFAIGAARRRRQNRQ